MKIEYVTISKTGRRPINEDAFNVIDEPKEGRWFGIVCDGMGGHINGEIASETIVKTITNYWSKHKNTKDSERKVVNAVREASVAFDKKSDKYGHCHMGSTMVLASIVGKKITIAHIGDSRCYLMRMGHFDFENYCNYEDDRIVYQTKDHVRIDFGWEVVDKCFFSYKPERAIADVAQFDIKSGDRILICSDGIYKSMSPKVLKECVLADNSLEEIADIFDSYCVMGSKDNYTAIIAFVE